MSCCSQAPCARTRSLGRSPAGLVVRCEAPRAPPARAACSERPCEGPSRRQALAAAGAAALLALAPQAQALPLAPLGRVERGGSKQSGLSPEQVKVSGHWRGVFQGACLDMLAWCCMFILGLCSQ